MNKFYQHPSYDGLANTCPPDDARMSSWEEQYNTQGFDNTVTWSLDDSLIRWLTPRLERFLEISKDCVDEPEFHNDIQIMLDGFNHYLSDEYNEYNAESSAKLTHSFEILAKNYRGLWW